MYCTFRTRFLQARLCVQMFRMIIDFENFYRQTRDSFALTGRISSKFLRKNELNENCTNGNTEDERLCWLTQHVRSVRYYSLSREATIILAQMSDVGWCQKTGTRSSIGTVTLIKAPLPMPMLPVDAARRNFGRVRATGVWR